MRPNTWMQALAGAFLISFSQPEASAQGMEQYIKSKASAADSSLSRWYGTRNYQPIWTGERLMGLAQFLQELDNHGLPPRLFNFNEWDARWRDPSLDPSERAATDVGTTQLALYAIQALAYGFTEPKDMHPKWKPISRKVSAYAFLDEALKYDPGQFSAVLLDKAPPEDARYDDMVKSLARYREIARFGGWRKLPVTAVASGPGDPYPEIKLLRARLQAEGDLPGGSLTKTRRKEIDQRTADAIKSFQFRHGIEPDGYLGQRTLAELNIPTSDRLNSLIINIDRLRWMPRAYEKSEHLEVNIAESALRMFDKGKQITVMPVIVGVKGKHQTPVFHGDIEHLFFRPYWNVPPSIARTEIVPAALSNPTAYMAEHNYEIIPFYGAAPNQILPVNSTNLNKAAAGSLYIRQTSGPDNSLGLVKFIFPNDSSVYLHDTPDHSLFTHADRDFSHGCVRVSRPDELADLLLKRNGGWNIDSVQAAMQDVNAPNRKEEFSRSMPVYLIYWTSTIMVDGRVRFDEDIYGHDVAMYQKFGLQ
ncbi:MAG: L,D-transpeptidase family protein [Verrucomicrobiales bacterium]